MIPSTAALRHEADEAWTACGRDEAVFRARFIEGTWAPRINDARHAREIDDEGLRLAFDAVLSPIPYRRRFGRMVRMTRTEAMIELDDCGESTDGLTDVELVALAAEYGIVVEQPVDDTTPV